jgi:hypothetical protein
MGCFVNYCIARGYSDALWPVHSPDTLALEPQIVALKEPPSVQVPVAVPELMKEFPVKVPPFEQVPERVNSSPIAFAMYEPPRHWPLMNCPGRFPLTLKVTPEPHEPVAEIMDPFANPLQSEPVQIPDTKSCELEAEPEQVRVSAFAFKAAKHSKVGTVTIQILVMWNPRALKNYRGTRMM